MEFLKLLLRFASIASFLLLLFGLYKPWVVLWWEDRQNRKKVILLYGCFGVTLWMMQYLF